MNCAIQEERVFQSRTQLHTRPRHNGRNPAAISLGSPQSPVFMKTTLFTYDGPAGTFWIRPEPAGRVQLGIDRRKLKTYKSPTAAARDVAARKTGYAPWDELEGELTPRDLRDWKRAGTAKRPRVQSAGINTTFGDT